ncbi:MAG: sugar ABC transporter ATP-binding protein [Clostridiales bacterium]|jgi:ABC transporter, permease protein|nr:MAG: sugar ABC transporter ATP-binding protein [Clostridiales bacterium]
MEIENVSKNSVPHVKKNTAQRYIVRALYIAVLLMVTVYLIFPYLYMLMRSLMIYDDAASTNPVYFFPHTRITFQNFIDIFSKKPSNPYLDTSYTYLDYLWNTVKIALFNIIAVPLSASLCAYSFSRLRWRCRGAVFALMMASIMIPGSVLTVPQYVLFASFGWTESALPLTIPTLFGGGAMNIFLLVQFMRNIPYEMENAAKIDGANAFQRYLMIVIPLCKPILIYIVIGTFNSVWGDFTGPLVYLKSREKWTLAVAIYYDSVNFSEGMDQPNIRMAVSVFISIIPAIIFFFYQNTLIEGVQMGALKG